eukprot:scaffold180443_cov31-Tisochrysis_lutea.AAC.5
MSTSLPRACVIAQWSVCARRKPTASKSTLGGDRAPMTTVECRGEGWLCVAHAAPSLASAEEWDSLPHKYRSFGTDVPTRLSVVAVGPPFTSAHRRRSCSPISKRSCDERVSRGSPCLSPTPQSSGLTRSGAPLDLQQWPQRTRLGELSASSVDACDPTRHLAKPPIAPGAAEQAELPKKNSTSSASTGSRCGRCSVPFLVVRRTRARLEEVRRGRAGSAQERRQPLERGRPSVFGIEHRGGSRANRVVARHDVIGRTSACAGRAPRAHMSRHSGGLLEGALHSQEELAKRDARECPYLDGGEARATPLVHSRQQT